MVPDEEAFKKKLGEVTMPNFYAVIHEAVRRSGLPADGIDYLAILHFKRSAHDAVLAELGLHQEQSTYLDEYGHLGQNDQVLSLELGLAAGKVSDGTPHRVRGRGPRLRLGRHRHPLGASYGLIGDMRADRWDHPAEAE